MFTLTDILAIVQIFAIADSLVTFAVTYVMDRRALSRWRIPLWATIVAMWIGIILPLVELLISNPPLVVLGFYNPLTKLGLILWIVAVGSLLYIARKIYILDLISFNKKRIPKLEHESPKLWGVDSLDSLLKGADEEEVNRSYPFILIADEETRPWRILYRFVVSGLNSNPNYGAIYFTFSRPAEVITRSLDSAFSSLEKQPDWNKIVIIDCYSKFAKHPRDSEKPYIFYANPNDPHEINAQYEKALQKLTRSCKSLRVIVDSLSDFIGMTDKTLATLYLRNNIVWEEQNNVESLYLWRSGVLEKETEAYYRWFTNGCLTLEAKLDENKKSYISGFMFGPFRTGPKQFKLDFDYNLIS